MPEASLRLATLLARKALVKAPLLRLLVTTIILLISVCLAGAAGTIYINFDTDASGNPLTAPDFFFQTGPLTDLYASLGVHFSGPNPGYGGAILNQGGSFGVPARSGENFLAFNAMSDLSYAIGPETIIFDTPMSSVSIYAAGGGGEYGPFTMLAFDSSGSSLGSFTASSPPGGYVELTMSSTQGIHSVELEETGFISWVYDDLSATPVPEPNSGAMAVGAFGVLVLWLGRNRRRPRLVKVSSNSAVFHTSHPPHPSHIRSNFEL